MSKMEKYFPDFVPDVLKGEIKGYAIGDIPKEFISDELSLSQFKQIMKPYSDLFNNYITEEDLFLYNEAMKIEYDDEITTIYSRMKFAVENNNIPLALYFKKLLIPILVEKLTDRKKREDEDKRTEEEILEDYDPQEYIDGMEYWEGLVNSGDLFRYLLFDNSGLEDVPFIKFFLSQIPDSSDNIIFKIGYSGNYDLFHYFKDFQINNFFISIILGAIESSNIEFLDYVKKYVPNIDFILFISNSNDIKTFSYLLTESKRSNQPINYNSILRDLFYDYTNKKDLIMWMDKQGLITSYNFALNLAYEWFTNDYSLMYYFEEKALETDEKIDLKGRIYYLFYYTDPDLDEKGNRKDKRIDILYEYKHLGNLEDLYHDLLVEGLFRGDIFLNFDYLMKKYPHNFSNFFLREFVKIIGIVKHKTHYPSESVIKMSEDFIKTMEDILKSRT